ncbi:MAG: hypothetical protein V7742_13975 [Halioglobus sp.]
MSNKQPWEIIEPGDNVVIVLGAGATISEMHRPGPPAIPPPCDANFLEIAAKCCKKDVDRLWRTFGEVWEGGEAYPLHHQRMEQLFAGTYLRVSQTQGNSRRGKLARQLYDELVLLLRNTLHETTNKAEPEEHIRLFSEVATCEPAAMDIVSFNYDCLADRAMKIGDAKGLWGWNHRDGYGFKPDNQYNPARPSTSKLMKLHGSMNWYIPIPGKARSTAYNPKSPIYVPNPPTRPDSPAWHRRQKIMGHDKGKRVFPLMIPPVFEKATQISGNLGGVWDQAEEKLASADVVIVWGYSLPVTDYHAEMLFAQSARRAKSRLVVVNPDKAALGRVTEVCGHQWSRWFFRAYHLHQAMNEHTR